LILWINLFSENVSAIVEYNYTAKESDELTLVKGAILNNIKRQSGGWWEGTLASNGKTGMFPDNFVRVLESDDKSPVVLRDKSETKNRRYKAVYSYTQNNNDELSLAVGDIIEFLGEVEEGWWRGKLAGKIGVFPSNFVEAYTSTSPIFANRRISNNNGTSNNNHSRSAASLNSSREDLVNASEKDAPTLPPKPVREQCKVIFAYKPANEDELELKEGEIITILSKELPDKGWWKGELKGKIGVFPDNFVQAIAGEGSPQKEHTNSTPERPPSSTKVLINNNSNNTSNSISKRMDSFGSKDSLNDTGITAGNVAAYRKSLESKCTESNVQIVSRSSTKINQSEIKSTAEIRKSLENLDERKSTPPPLTKKPAVPIKKSPTVGSVAGNIFSGLKQKVKSVEQKITHHDSLDGVGASKVNASPVADNGDKGISGERLRRNEECEFDQVERNASILPDMRANRAKAPKRRLPSSQSSFGENQSYQNGDSPVPASPNSANDVITKSEEDLTKPKPREWEKNRAPWMDELKASQAKKTSPGIETKSPDSSHESHNGSHKKSNETNNFEVRSSSIDIKTSTDSVLHSNSIKEKTPENSLTKSLATKISISESSTASIGDETTNSIGVKGRPTSVTLRNVNLPPVGRVTKTIHDNGGTVQTSTATITSKTVIQDDGLNNSNPTVLTTTVTSDNVCSRVVELELRMAKMEKLVQKQNATIEELLKSLKDESDKVRNLKYELEKYAQCVTQV